MEDKLFEKSVDNGRPAAVPEKGIVKECKNGTEEKESGTSEDHSNNRDGKGYKSILKGATNKNKNKTDKKVRFNIDIEDEDDDANEISSDNHIENVCDGKRKLLQLTLFAEVTDKKPSYYVKPYKNKKGKTVEGYWRQYEMKKTTRKKKKTYHHSNNKMKTIKEYFGANNMNN